MKPRVAVAYIGKKPAAGTVSPLRTPAAPDLGARAAAVGRWRPPAASLQQLRAQIARRLERGDSLDSVERELIVPSRLSEDLQSALWLYGWSLPKLERQRLASAARSSIRGTAINSNHQNERDSHPGVAESGPAAPDGPAQGESSPSPSLPAVSLPKGGGAIHGMGEKFGVNPVTGTGTLTIPLPTSPGRAGFGPQLALSYDSGAGNGPFGLGWQLAVPAIPKVP
jgi:hypothetical protein